MAEAFYAGANLEDTDLVRAQGVSADDDNDPAPESAPQRDVPQPSPLQELSWGWDGIDDRRSTSMPNVGAAFCEFTRKSLQNLSMASIFQFLLPKKF